MLGSDNEWVTETCGFVVICAEQKNVRKIMLAAEALDMVGGDYAFFNMEIFNGTAASYNSWYNASDTDKNNERAKKAYDAVLTVTTRAPTGDPYRNFSNEVKEMALEKFEFEYEDTVNPFVSSFFDAVLIYAAALNETLRLNGSITDGEDIVNNIRNKTFDFNKLLPWEHENITIDAVGDRKADYSLMDMNPETGVFELPGHRSSTGMGGLAFWVFRGETFLRFLRHLAGDSLQLLPTKVR
ncbi:atrial natriuretic peptide receptor 3-like [Penaeus chinensis]|uniref:atrial natriuretic peptide receptor 3-like n=1 Tax=Penaeus chinensis TaxID=139456 RepID=UPI001FB73F6D|nr:atrial natriuretic peptide receptor 3-like [Penaeus chinensis]